MSRPPLESVAQHVIERRCALFIGPDLGESAGGFRGLPTSWQIADELAAQCGYRGRYRPLPQIAQIFQRERGRPALVSYLRQRIGADDYRPLPVHELIARIPFPVIVSGGWDTLLEQALDGQAVSYRTIRSNADLPFLRPGEERLLLFKPYGSVDNPNSLLVTEDDQLGVFYDLERVVARLKDVVEQYALLLIGYALAQDAVFVRIYHDIRHAQAAYQPPAVAVQSLARAEDAAAWEARGVEAVIEDPATFLRQLAEVVARAQGRVLALPDLEALSTAPRLTMDELGAQAAILNSMMDQIGVADLVEQTNVPLLSEEQLRDIEAMRAAYERLTRAFAPEQGSAHVWLRQGNLEYVRQNYARAEEYYRRALAAEPGLAEAHHNLHYVRLAQGDWAGGLEAYQQAIAAQPALALLPARYRIDAVLGGGGVGVVYRAFDTQTGKPVAVKILQRAQAQTERILEVFKREAHVLQSLDHPSIVRMIDFQTYRGNYFIVMEFLEGETLKEALARAAQPFSLDRAFRLIEQVCEALTHAHSANIIHRDVKPSNIFLVGEHVKLIDFGLARPIAGGELSTPGAAAGTLTYMAPEQAEGRGSDARTDEYAVTTVFYEMVTRRNPAQGTYRPLSELRPGLNSALDLVIEKARERAPNDRYPTVAAFCGELRQVVAMQAAAENAPLALRLIARAAQRMKLVVERGWLAWLLVSLAAGFLVPAIWTAAVPRGMVRYTASGMIITLLLAVIAGPFTVAVGRRVRSAPIAAYGTAMGAVLGLVNSLLWLRSFSFLFVRPELCRPPEPCLGYGGTAEFFMLTIESALLSLGTAVGVFLILPAAGWLARRTGRSYAAGFFLAFGLLTVGLLVAALALPPGWYGDLSVVPEGFVPPP